MTPGEWVIAAVTALGLLLTAGSVLWQQGRHAGVQRADMHAVRADVTGLRTVLESHIQTNRDRHEKLAEQNVACERERGAMGAQLSALGARVDRISEAS